MKPATATRPALILVAGFFFHGCASAPPVAVAPPRIAVVGINDFHGSLAVRRHKTGELDAASSIEYEVSGASTLAAMLKSLKQEWGDRLLVVDAGDEWQGSIDSTLEEGASVVDFLNRVGVGVAAIGNHEFDFGPGRSQSGAIATDLRAILKKRLSEAKYPYVAANIFERSGATVAPVQWNNLAPSTLITVGPYRVGVIGATTVDTPSTTRVEYIHDLEFKDTARMTFQEATRLRAQGANLILLAAHLGTACEDSMPESDGLKVWKTRVSTDPQGTCDEQGEINRLLQSLPTGTLDGVIAGHTHEIVHHWINGVPVIEGAAFNRYINVMYFTFDPETGRLRPEQTQIEGPIPVCPKVFENQMDCDGKSPAPANGRGALVPLVLHGRTLIPDPEIETWLAADLARNEPIKKQIVGFAERPVTHSPRQENPFNNLVADVIRLKAQTDFAIVNSDGVRSALEAGPITFDDVYRSLPFENTISTLRLTGRQIKLLLRIMNSGPYGLAGVSNLQVTLKPFATPHLASRDLDQNGQIEPWEKDRIIDVRQINGDPLADSRTYTVATYDYLARGGDHLVWFMNQLKPSDRVFDAFGPTRQAVIYYLKDAGKINSEGRPLLDPSHPRIIFKQK